MQTKVLAVLQAALAHHEAGRLAAAEVLYARVRAAEPRNFDALHLSGFLALQQQRGVDGVALLQKATALNPRHAQCALRLAHGLKALGRLTEVRVAAARVAKLDPACGDAHFLLGELASRTEGFAAAVPHFRRVTELQPAAADGWANLGLALGQTRQLAEARTCFERALALDPANVPALAGRALVLQESHAIRAAVDGYAQVLARDPGHHEARSARLLALHYLEGVSREEMFAEHLAFGVAVSPARGRGVSRQFLNVPEPGRRLRVAFLSPDFRTHSVIHFIEPLLAHLDREQFEIFLYHDHVTLDAMSARVRTHARVWRHFAGLPTDIVEAAIRADAPDVLIDLAGHTGFNRLPLVARRLAPVQMSYLGYPDTTGLAEMDFRLTDAVADPWGDADRFATERLVRFAGCAWAYEPPVDAPDIVLPASQGTRGVTFGCFNNFSKVSDATVRGWARVLASLPGSQLRLKNHGLDEPALAAAVAGRFAALGVEPSRIELLGRTPGVAEHLAAYAAVDVVLDTFPYHGTTTTCEALWQGRPVVTLAGDRHASRVGASLLNAAGHPEWVARSWDEYVRIAATVAGDLSGRICVAQRMRGELAVSPLLDHAGQAARLGAAFRGAWGEWCANSSTALCA